jgi:hypothetical protein
VTRFLVNVSLGLVAFGAAPLALSAQTPGTRLRAAVEVVGLEVYGDTMAVRYRVRTDVATPERFRALTLPLAEGAIYVRADTVSGAWRSTNHLGDRPVARWAHLGNSQSEVSPPLSLTAFGVPELADAWIEGHHEPFEEGTAEADSANADTTGYQYGARKIRIIGVGPRPSTLSVNERFTRLGAALGERCRLGFVTKAGLCNSLTAKLSAAESAVARGNGNAASGQLGTFKAEISAQRGKGVDETTFWLLSALADVTIAGLPAR